MQVRVIDEASDLVFTHTEDSGFEERVSRIFDCPFPMVV